MVTNTPDDAPPTLEVLFPDPAARERFVSALADAENDLAGLAASHAITLEQVALLPDQPRVWRLLENLSRLEALRGQIAVHRYRFNALAKLVDQATVKDQDVSAETSRRAATDLLKADVRLPLPPGGVKRLLEAAGDADGDDADEPLLPPDLPPGRYAYALHEALTSVGDAGADQDGAGGGGD